MSEACGPEGVDEFGWPGSSVYVGVVVGEVGEVEGLAVDVDGGCAHYPLEMAAFTCAAKALTSAESTQRRLLLSGSNHSGG